MDIVLERILIRQNLKTLKARLALSVFFASDISSYLVIDILEAHVIILEAHIDI